MPTVDNLHLAQCVIKIDGTPLEVDIMNNLLECSVENSLHLPDVCTIRFFDHELEHLDKSLWTAGKQVDVQMGYSDERNSGQMSLQKVFEGEIIGVDLDIAGHDLVTFSIRALNRAHRLHRGNKRRTFLNSSHSDIVSQLAGEASLTADVDSTPVVHDYVVQNNETNWEFMRRLAGRENYNLYVSGTKLCFKKVPSAETGEELEYGVNLRSFRPRLTATGQVNTSIVRSWDYKTKKEIIGTASSVTQVELIGLGSKHGAAAQQAFSSQADVVIVDRPVASESEANRMAQSALDERAHKFLEADGLTFGNNKIKAGKSVTVKHVGQRFSGSYLVTSCVHTYTPAEGYTTQFICSGKEPSTLVSMLRDEEKPGPAFGGYIVIGIVTNNQDPENLARVKVKFPWLDDTFESWWCRIASPMAGNDRGFEFIPEVDDEVLVGFEHGDPTRAFILGSLWNAKDKPPRTSSDATNGNAVNKRVIKTRVGHEILLEDESGSERIKITTKDKRIFHLNDADKEIVVDDSQGNSMTILTNSGKIHFKCVGDFMVEATKKVIIKGQTGIELETPAGFSAKGATVNVEATGTSTIKAGASMSISANAVMEVKSSAIMTIQGTMVKIN